MKNMIIGIAGAIAAAVLGGTGAFASGQMIDSSATAMVHETVWESDTAVCPYDGECHTYADADNDGVCDHYETGSYGTGCHGARHHGSGSCYGTSYAGGYGSGHHSSHHGGWHE